MGIHRLAFRIRSEPPPDRTDRTGVPSGPPKRPGPTKHVVSLVCSLSCPEFVMRVDPMSGGVRPCSTSVLLFLSATLSLFSPRMGVAQTASGLPASDEMRVVVISEKSPFLAGVLELVTFPTIGYAYAGNWKRGLPSAAVRILGFALWGEQMVSLDSDPCDARCVSGLLMLIGGWVWAASDAAGTARRTNEKRRAEALGAVVLPTFGRRSVGAQIQIRIPR